MWIYSTRTERNASKLRPGAAQGEFVVTYTEPSPPTDRDLDRTHDQVVVLVPGDRARWREVQVLVNSMETRLTAVADVECRALIWPSMRHLLDFASARKAAEGSAKAFARVLKRLKHEAGFTKIHLVAHSLGVRAALAALAEIDESVCDSVVLLGGEPPAKLLREGGRFQHALSKTNKLLNYWSASDKVLGWTGRLLGSAGSLGTRTVDVDGVVDVDAESVYGDYVFHDTYTYSDELLIDVAKRLDLPRVSDEKPFVGFDYLRRAEAG